MANLFLTPSKKPTAIEAPSAEVDVRSKVSQLKDLMAEQQALQQAAMDEIEVLLQSEAT